MFARPIVSTIINLQHKDNLPKTFYLRIVLVKKVCPEVLAVLVYETSNVVLDLVVIEGS
jgi:hypothetical protein